jgi:hypothetical protein
VFETPFKELWIYFNDEETNRNKAEELHKSINEATYENTETEDYINVDDEVGTGAAVKKIGEFVQNHPQSEKEKDDKGEGGRGEQSEKEKKKKEEGENKHSEKEKEDKEKKEGENQKSEKEKDVKGKEEGEQEVNAYNILLDKYKTKIVNGAPKTSERFKNFH